MTPDDLRQRLTLPEYPRSAGYDPMWTLRNAMGPNPLWLVEALTARMHLEPGMRVLDLGCGKAITSIFLAREFGVDVVAADLWIKPSDNWPRIVEAGVAGRVLPVYAEAHQLPFAHGYFDAIVSVDAYHYFGTDDSYLGYLNRFVRPGGQLGIAVPMLTVELPADLGAVPEHLSRFWNWEFWSFHSANWWRRHWAKTGLVEVEAAEAIPDAWRQWLLFDEVSFATGTSPLPDWAEGEIELNRVDAGRTLTLGWMVANRRAVPPLPAPPGG